MQGETKWPPHPVLSPETGARGKKKIRASTLAPLGERVPEWRVRGSRLQREGSAAYFGLDA